MTDKIEIFNKTQLKKDLPDIRAGDTIRIHQKIKETPKKDKSSTGQENKERIQIFEGVVIARKHGKEVPATITVRKVISGIGVEKIFPIHSPLIVKIEVIKRAQVRRAKLYYLRTAKGKKAKLKMKEFAGAIAEEPAVVETTPSSESIPEITETKETKTKENE